jgi:crotonobetainyl-CoA:carnitine CoA-transferase CaiB-like acyl-CoA transferase
MPGLLEGVRIIDLSTIWAAPLGTRWLADMGAEVIKIQEVPKLTPAIIQRLKRLREQREQGEAEAAAAQAGGGTATAAPPRATGVTPNQNPVMAEKGFTGYVLQTEGNKKAVSLDFEKPRGKELLVKLIEVSDIVVDNHRPIVLERIGLDFEGLTKIKPGIILLKVAAMGQTGPERQYSGFGATIDGLGGLAFHTGYHDAPEQPMRSGINYADPVAGTYVGSALMMALIHRHKTGEGQSIDVSLRETLPIAEMFMEYSMNGRFWPRLGNREAGRAPHGVYRCAGADRWIAIAVNTEAEWKALIQAMGEPAWADEPRFSDMHSRWRNHDELDRHLSAWTADKDKVELAKQLQAAGVAATPVLTPPEAMHSEHHAARDWWHMMHQEHMGDYHYYGPGWRLPNTPAHIHSAPAYYGQHNREVYLDMLGLSEADYQQLLADQIVSESALPTLPPGA